jgi:hypothetical protein
VAAGGVAVDTAVSVGIGVAVGVAVTVAGSGVTVGVQVAGLRLERDQQGISNRGVVPSCAATAFISVRVGTPVGTPVGSGGGGGVGGSGGRTAVGTAVGTCAVLTAEGTGAGGTMPVASRVGRGGGTILGVGEGHTYTYTTSGVGGDASSVQPVSSHRKNRTKATNPAPTRAMPHFASMRCPGCNFMACPHQTPAPAC